MKKHLLFLNYDGVVNIPMWNYDYKTGKFVCKYNYPSDNSVNHFQAVQWVSEFCLKHNYDIVVTSTWRKERNYKECLINGGLRNGVNIIGKTPSIKGLQRGDEISEYLKRYKTEHIEPFCYIIIDDNTDMTIHLDNLIKCDCNIGFTINEFNRAETLHKSLIKKLKRESKK